MAVAVPPVATLSASALSAVAMAPLGETAERKPDETRALDNQAVIRGLGQLAPRVALSSAHASRTGPRLRPRGELNPPLDNQKLWGRFL